MVVVWVIETAVRLVEVKDNLLVDLSVDGKVAWMVVGKELTRVALSVHWWAVVTVVMKADVLVAC